MKVWDEPLFHPTESTMPELTVKIDRAGRVSIPKKFRQSLALEDGDTLMIEQDGDRLTLRPLAPPGRLRRKGKFWVFNAGEPISIETTNRLIDEMRNGGGRDD
jgi:AbrB family looped-hinge helix DNA binding protein